MSPRTLDELLAEASSRIDRLEPIDAAAEMHAGALLVDTRSSDYRRRDGVVPGALHIPRALLEWRLEPGGKSRTPHAPESGARVIVLCQEGFSSVLAAASLAELGYDAADVMGGFAAWARAGLPVSHVPLEAGGVALGKSPPDT